ncbi:hypothetical protein [Krasilnikovia sp. MM14-A1004]|uniref:hypothetical protein n=1 Tax=Krasilnikovia sp. MM14-A1004 TaxID=3373541 RepID=UPI00399D50DF
MTRQRWAVLLAQLRRLQPGTACRRSSGRLLPELRLLPGLGLPGLGLTELGLPGLRLPELRLTELGLPGLRLTELRLTELRGFQRWPGRGLGSRQATRLGSGRGRLVRAIDGRAVLGLAGRAMRGLRVARRRSGSDRGFGGRGRGGLPGRAGLTRLSRHARLPGRCTLAAGDAARLVGPGT